MTRPSSKARAALDIEIVDSLDRARSISEEWRALSIRVGGGPFSLPELAIPWMVHLCRGASRVVTARNGAGDLVGVAPFFERRRGPITSVGFIGTGVGAVGELLVGPSKADVSEALLDAALDGRRLVLDLQNYRHGAPGLRQLRRMDHLRTRAMLQDECPTIDLGSFDSAADVLAVPQRSGLRKKLAKAERRLEGHAVDFGIVAEPDDVARTWLELQPLYDRAEAHHPRQHFGRGAEGAFFELALQELASAKLVSIATMRIDGQPAAFDVYVHVDPVDFAILGRMDPSMTDFSPGQLLLRYGVDAAIERGAAVVDLQLGADLYKLRWASGGYDTVHVRSASARDFAFADSVLRAVDAGFSVRSRLRR